MGPDQDLPPTYQPAAICAPSSLAYLEVHIGRSLEVAEQVLLSASAPGENMAI
jgi:hypothetical protein